MYLLYYIAYFFEGNCQCVVEYLSVLNNISTSRFWVVLALNELAQERGQTLAQMALSWVYRQPTVTSVLIGASRPQQIIENVGMLKNCSFSQAELAKIDEIVK